MRGIDQRFARQGQQAGKQAVIERAGIAGGQVSAAGAADRLCQQPPQFHAFMFVMGGNSTAAPAARFPDSAGAVDPAKVLAAWKENRSFVPLEGGQGLEVIDLCVPVRNAGRSNGFVVGSFALVQVLELAQQV